MAELDLDELERLAEKIAPRSFYEPFIALIKRVRELEAERREALRYAESVLSIVFAKHHPQASPLAGDLLGMLTQFDNILTAYEPSLRAENERLRAALEDTARLDWLDSANARLNAKYGTRYSGASSSTTMLRA